MVYGMARGLCMPFIVVICRGLFRFVPRDSVLSALFERVGRETRRTQLTCIRSL